MDGTQYSVSDAGTEYQINYTDETGITQTVTVFLQDGEAGAGGMQGYTANKFSFSKNPIPNGEIIINAEDIEAVLRSKGFEDAANAIAAGGNYDMYAQQSLYIYDPTTRTKIMEKYDRNRRLAGYFNARTKSKSQSGVTTYSI